MQCLSILCKGDQRRMKQLRKCDGVKIIVRQLRRYSSGRDPVPLPSTSWRVGGDSDDDGDVDGMLSLGVCAVDCVWSCILGCKKSEEGFIINFNGVGHLLECLEVGPSVLKRQIVGCLSDLLETSALARLQFLQWNSPITLRSGVKLLLGLLVREQRSTGAVGFDPPADIGERLVLSSTESLQSSTGMRDDVLRRETLTREERQQLEAIRLYPELRELELWQVTGGKILSSVVPFVSPMVGILHKRTDGKILSGCDAVNVRDTPASVCVLLPVVQTEDLLEGTSSGVEPLTVGDRKWIEDRIAEHLTRSCWVKSLQKQMVLAEEKAEFEDMLLSIGNQVSAESM
ncbi:hypothetical protein FOZ62_009305, partial [Perkinsus olseni]